MFPPMTGQCSPAGGGAIAGAPPALEVVVLVGLQGSGKSTFYRARFAATHALVSRDRFRNNPRPSRRQRELLEEALRQRRSVVVDNTNPTVADRAAILSVARAHGARATCYFFGRDVRAAIARNARREGKERVPVVGILATAKRLVPPTAAEGFDAVYAVTAQRDGAFAVQEIERAPVKAAPGGVGGGGGGGAPGAA